MKKINIKILPSIITLGNLFCGFLAIAYISEGKLNASAWLIFLGMIFDMLDGKVARLTKGSSDFGMQLDSLADMITFGVAPAFLIKVFVLQKPALCPSRIAWTISLLYVICAAIRLARFNVETDHEESSHLYFKGLATPGGAGVLASLYLSSSIISNIIPIIYYKALTLGITFILGFLMVSRISYIHLGIQLAKKCRPLGELIGLIFIGSIIALEPSLLQITLLIGFLGYAFFVPLETLFTKDNKKDSEEKDYIISFSHTQK